MNLIPPIRPLIKPDFVDADALLALAFNSHFSRMLDLQLYLKMQPDGWFVMQKEERLVGMVGALNYGTYAHVGFMAIHPDFQHQGLGMALMQHLLADLDDKNVPLVTLDASLAGEGLYAKMGFINLDETVTFQHPGQVTLADLPAGVEPMTVGDLDAVVQWDEPVFGAERLKVFQPFLEVFPGRIFIQRDNQGQINGFLVAQPRRIGPWAATDLQSAEHLLQSQQPIRMHRHCSLNTVFTFIIATNIC
jgi:N-acetylglutamate synthase-like GNAT family acetyltransferase